MIFNNLKVSQTLNSQIIIQPLKIFPKAWHSQHCTSFAHNIHANVKSSLISTSPSAPNLKFSKAEHIFGLLLRMWLKMSGNQEMIIHLSQPLNWQNVCFGNNLKTKVPENSEISISLLWLVTWAWLLTWSWILSSACSATWPSSFGFSLFVDPSFPSISRITTLLGSRMSSQVSFQV